MKKEVAVACLIVVLVFGLWGCRDPVTLFPGNDQLEKSALQVISDGAHVDLQNPDARNEHFFFLPPLVAMPTYSGIFDASLSPTVRVVQEQHLIAEFTMNTGPGSETIRVVPSDEHYIANWHIKRFNLDPSLIYRIKVSLEDNELGYADVKLADRRQSPGNHDTDECIRIQNGRTFPIKFRIEEGVQVTPGVGVWSSTTVLPYALRYHRSTAHADFLYVIGGFDGRYSRREVWYARMNSDGTVGSWISTTSLPSVSHAHSVSISNNRLYVIGGHHGYYQMATVWYATIHSDGSLSAWDAATALPFERNWHSSEAHRGYLYVIGGTRPRRTFLSEVLYATVNPDGTTGNWNSTTPLPTARGVHTSLIQNGYLYVIGGTTDTGELADVLYARINPDGTVGEWENTTPLPVPLYAHTSVVHNDYLYVLGGLDSSDTQTSMVIYARLHPDGTIGAWNMTTSLPTARSSHSSVTHDGFVYAIGGLGITDTNFDEVLFSRFNH